MPKTRGERKAYGTVDGYGVRRNMISKDLTGEDAEDRELWRI